MRSRSACLRNIDGSPSSCLLPHFSFLPTSHLLPPTSCLLPPTSYFPPPTFYFLQVSLNADFETVLKWAVIVPFALTVASVTASSLASRAPLPY